MIIREIQLKNFGRFTDRAIGFEDGINVVWGENEAGKTTLYTSIGALLFGMEKKRGRAAWSDSYTTYRPRENQTWYEAAMRFEIGGKQFFLERNFYHGEKSARLVCETDGEELEVSQGDLGVLLGDADAELYFNTAAVGQLKMKPREIIYAYLKNYIGSLQESGNQSIDVVKALENLEKKKKLLEQEEKNRVRQIRQQIAGLESKLELVQREMDDCTAQLQRCQAGSRVQKAPDQKGKQGFFARLLAWMKKIFSGRKHRAREAQMRREEYQRQERILFLQELLGEKESLREELTLMREQFYEQLQEQPKETEIRAVSLAMERIRQMSALRQEEVMEKLLKKASELLCSLTGGKYEKMILEDGEPKVWDGHRMLKLFQVSSGCADQIYLSLRIALQDLFFTEETMPLLFDDAFVYFDDRRLEQLLIQLEGLGRQIIIFSCQTREMKLLDKNEISYHKILLKDA